MLLKDDASSAALAYARPGAPSAKAQLAAFGGQRAVPEDLVVSWPASHSGHLAALNRVIRSGKYHRVNHPVVTALEQDFAAWTGHWTVRAVSTGTAAIHVALDYAREQGARQQATKVIAAALNWPGAIGPIAFAGLEPVFVDVSLADAAIDQAAAARALSGDTAAVLITHLFGNPIPAPELRAAVRATGRVRLVDDSAQSIAVTCSRDGGAPLDSDALALSGNGAKHLGAGELGLLCTADPGLIEHVDRVSLTSSARNGERVFSPMTAGYNYRPNVFSASVALSRLPELDEQLAQRRQNAAVLTDRLAGLLPLYDIGRPRNSFLNVPLRIDPARLGLPPGPAARDLIVELLQAEGVPVWVWLRKPVWEHLPFWRDRWSLADFPNTRTLLDTMFYLSEVAPPNDDTAMHAYADAFEKVWSALPELRAEAARHGTATN
ncbi:DegT/DnrJ/EryC1/StrS family aminotransferase [Inquilinus sp.]|uniref:DegT/DnrJ/EryC1/StrS family aminotransferase n=1 Tax=Inquilinus sp. TaxID=1932117 RepID=UPI0031D1FC87